MTLFNIASTVNERFPNTDITEICQIVNELEFRLVNEIFSPHGIEARAEKLNPEADIHTAFVLGDEYLSLYLNFLFSILSLKELDFDAANVYSAAFNQSFSELSALYRRNNTPIKNTLLRGGI